MYPAIITSVDVVIALRGTADVTSRPRGRVGSAGARRECQLMGCLGFAAHKVSSNVTLPIGGGRIAYVVAPSTARWFWWSVASICSLYCTLTSII